MTYETMFVRCFVAGVLALAGGCVVGDEEGPEAVDEVEVGDENTAYGVYQGCFRDGNPRALPHSAGERSDMTPSRCESMCAGYKYAGVQYYGQCFCGNSLAYERRPDAECNTRCNGDGSKYCGGAWRNSIYTVAAGGGGGGSGGGSVGTRLSAGQKLHPGQYLEQNGVRLVYQGDGNLVLYQGSKALWSSRTNGTSSGFVAMQGDGNLVLYDGGGTARWASNTSGNSGAVTQLVGDSSFHYTHFYVRSSSNRMLACHPRSPLGEISGACCAFYGDC